MMRRKRGWGHWGDPVCKRGWGVSGFGVFCFVCLGVLCFDLFFIWEKKRCLHWKCAFANCDSCISPWQLFLETKSLTIAEFDSLSQVQERTVAERDSGMQDRPQLTIAISVSGTIGDTSLCIVCFWLLCKLCFWDIIPLTHNNSLFLRPNSYN